VSKTSKKVDADLVNHPRHYNEHPSGVECIVVTEHMSFNIGSALKYLWRAGKKDGAPTDEDLRKAVWYIERERTRLKVDADPVIQAGKKL
jgi:hypothetical protein